MLLTVTFPLCLCLLLAVLWEWGARVVSTLGECWQKGLASHCVTDSQPPVAIARMEKASVLACAAKPACLGCGSDLWQLPGSREGALIRPCGQLTSHCLPLPQPPHQLGRTPLEEWYTLRSLEISEEDNPTESWTRLAGWNSRVVWILALKTRDLKWPGFVT